MLHDASNRLIIATAANTTDRLSLLKVTSNKKQVWSANRCVLSTFFSTFNMDRRTDQQSYFPIEMQFYISAMFVGFSDEIYKERPSFLDFEKKLVTDGRKDRPTDGRTDERTDPPIEMRGRV